MGTVGRGPGREQPGPGRRGSRQLRLPKEQFRRLREAVQGPGAQRAGPDQEGVSFLLVRQNMGRSPIRLDVAERQWTYVTIPQDVDLPLYTVRH